MEYYLFIDNEKRGPYSVAELAARGIGAETLVMAEGGGQWIPAWQVEELRPIIRPRGGAAEDIPNRMAAQAGRPEEAEPVVGQPVAEASEVAQGYAPQSLAQPQGRASVPPSRRKKRGGCLIGVLVVLLVVLGLLVATCPKARMHKEAVADVVSETVGEAFQLDSIPADDPASRSMKSFAHEATRQIVGVAVDQLLTVDNYWVCSVGRIRYADKRPVVSVGVLGHVFTVDKADLKTLARRYSQEAQRRLEEKVTREVRQNITDPIDDALGDEVGGIVKDLAGKLLDKVGEEIGNALSGDKFEADSI